jgi:hypothetical protein
LLCVVTPLDRRQNAIVCGALINSKNGLCNAYTIKQSEIFYFAEYRNELASIAARESSWSQNITTHIYQATSEQEDAVDSVETARAAAVAQG